MLAAEEPEFVPVELDSTAPPTKLNNTALVSPSITSEQQPPLSSYSTYSTSYANQKREKRGSQLGFLNNSYQEPHSILEPDDIVDLADLGLEDDDILQQAYNEHVYHHDDEDEDDIIIMPGSETTVTGSTLHMQHVTTNQPTATPPQLDPRFPHRSSSHPIISTQPSLFSCMSSISGGFRSHHSLDGDPSMQVMDMRRGSNWKKWKAAFGGFLCI